MFVFISVWNLTDVHPWPYTKKTLPTLSWPYWMCCPEHGCSISCELKLCLSAMCIPFRPYAWKHVILSACVLRIHASLWVDGWIGKLKVWACSNLWAHGRWEARRLEVGRMAGCAGEGKLKVEARLEQVMQSSKIICMHVLCGHLCQAPPSAWPTEGSHGSLQEA